MQNCTHGVNAPDNQIRLYKRQVTTRMSFRRYQCDNRFHYKHGYFLPFSGVNESDHTHARTHARTLVVHMYGKNPQAKASSWVISTHRRTNHAITITYQLSMCVHLRKPRIISPLRSLPHRTTGCLDDRLLTMMTDTGFNVP